MKPDSTISAMRPSMIALVSTTMCGSPRPAPSPLGVRPADEPDGLGGDQQVLPLGDGQSEHAEAEEERHAERQPRPPRLGEADSGKPSRRPMSRPSRRPMTAVTNSAVDSSSTRAISHVAGTTVRYGRIAKPDDDPGDHPGRDERPGVAGVAEQARRRRRRGRARRAPPARHPGHGDSGSIHPRGSSRRRPDRAAARRGVSLASPARRRHDARRVGARRGRDRVAQRRDLDDPQARDVRRGARRGPVEARWRVVKPSRAASRSRRSSRRPAAARPGARPRRSRPSPATTGRSRSDDARARATGRSRPGSPTLRPPARFA